MDFSAYLTEVIPALTRYDWGAYVLPVSIVGLSGLLFACYLYRADLRQLPREFEIFTNTSYPAIGQQTTLRFSNFADDFSREHGGQPIVIADGHAYSAALNFAAAVKQCVESSQRPALEISSPQPSLDINLLQLPQKGDFVFTKGPFKGLSCLFPHIDLVTLDEPKPSNYSIVIIRGARISRIVVNESFHGFLYFEDCWIGSFQIKARESTPSTRLSLSRCYIGNLDMGSNGCSAFSMRQGGVKHIICPPPCLPPPVINAFEIDDAVVLHQAPRHVGEEQVGSYRDLLIHIRNHSSPFTQQLVAATIFHLERKGEPSFLRSVSFCYRIFSAYNTRPGRPLVWMLFSIAICSYVAFAFDLAVVTKVCNGKDVSWIAGLCDQGPLGQASRSFTLILNSFMNPFGVFSDNALVKSRTLSFNIVLILTALMNLVWVALTAFSVKTRFTGKASTS